MSLLKDAGMVVDAKLQACELRLAQIENWIRAEIAGRDNPVFETLAVGNQLHHLHVVPTETGIELKLRHEGGKEAVLAIKEGAVSVELRHGEDVPLKLVLGDKALIVLKSSNGEIRELDGDFLAKVGATCQ